MTQDIEKFLPELQEAYNEFVQIEFQGRVKEIDPNEILPIAFTEEVYDANYKYDYCIQCSLDLRSQLDIYEMYNPFVHVTVRMPSTYENMIENLSASFDAWITCQNGLDYDYLSDLVDRHKAREDLSDELRGLNQQGIEVNFY